MAWKEVTTNAVDIKKHKGEPYEGTYNGFKEIETKIGKQKIYSFLQDDGHIVGIYGFTNLNIAMENIANGSKVRLTYMGTENVKTKYGMKDVHQVKVEIDTEEKEEIPF